MTLSDRLLDPDEVFSQQEVYTAFEALAEKYGYHKDPSLPVKGAIAETATLTIPHFEDLGVMIVRPKTIQDSMITLPNLMDALLENNINPSQQTLFNLSLIALMRTVVVSPPGIVDQLLRSPEGDYLAREIDGTRHNVFIEFAQEYGNWAKMKSEAVAQKKSGAVTAGSGTESSL